MGGLSCKKAEALIELLLDDRLAEPDRERLDEHLERCESCRRYRRAALFTLDALESQPLVKPTRQSLDRMWAGLQEKLEDTSSTNGNPHLDHSPGSKRWMPARLLMLGGAAAAVAAGIVLLFWGVTSSPVEQEQRSAEVAITEDRATTPTAPNVTPDDDTARAERAAIPSLILTGGTAEHGEGEEAAPAPVGTRIARGEAISVPTGALAQLARGDEMQIALGPETTIVVADESVNGLQVSLSRGWLAGRVEPGDGELDLEIATPIGVVHVIGTIFAVEVEREEAVEVRVHRGEVSFQPDEGELRILRAGQLATYPESRTAAVEPLLVERDQALLDGDMSALEDTSPVARPTIEELFVSAEAARRRGELQRAAGIYQRIAAQDRGGAAGGNALISLGQLSLGPLGQPSRARRAFSTYLDSRRRTLRQEAYVGLIRSQRALGRLPAARRTAQRYLEEYPTGRYRRLASSL